MEEKIDPKCSNQLNKELKNVKNPKIATKNGERRKKLIQMHNQGQLGAKNWYKYDKTMKKLIA